MDATTQLSTDTPFYWQFYNPLTGAPYAPTPAPTGVVYRLNVDGTRTALVGVPTPVALTAIAGLTGAYTYVLDDSLNTALGTLIGQATTTDAVLTPYPEYATRNYVVEVQKFTFSADKVNAVAQVASVDNGAITNAAIADNAITAAKIATDAIGSAQLAASGITEIQSGLATATSISNLQAHGDANWATGASAPTVSQIVDGVWDELLAGHSTPDSAAQILIAAAAGGGSAPTVSQIVNGILNELLAGHTTPGSVAVALSLIDSIYAAVQTIGAGVTYTRSPVSENGDTTLRQGVRYTGTYALTYTSDSAADLLASGITVALNFADETFPASSITGSAGAWAVRVPITEIQTADIAMGTYDGQLALYDDGIEVPELSNFKVTMAVNP